MENVYQSMTYSCRPVPILLRGLRGQLVPKLVLLCRFVLAIVVKNVLRCCLQESYILTKVFFFIVNLVLFFLNSSKKGLSVLEHA